MQSEIAEHELLEHRFLTPVGIVEIFGLKSIGAAILRSCEIALEQPLAEIGPGDLGSRDEALKARIEQGGALEPAGMLAYPVSIAARQMEVSMSPATGRIAAMSGRRRSMRRAFKWRL